MEQESPVALDKPTVLSREITLEAWQQKGQWFNYDGHAIFSRMEGQGEALVLIHGYPTASWDWSRLWPYLTPHYRVMALDMLGFGFSDKPANRRYSIDDQADLHQGWLEGLGLKRVHLMVHDYGCSVAQELLARQQEGRLGFTIASVCFLNGALFPEVHRPLLVQRLLSGPIGGLVSRGMSRRTFDVQFRRLFGGCHWPSQAELDNFWYLLTYNNGRGILHRLIRFMEERRCHRNRWVGALLRAEMPTAVIFGRTDPISGVAMARRYQELVSNADACGLPRVGHYPHYEAPQQVFTAYQAFRSHH
ncbi:alpha/beta fold hydrolase [Marinobacter mobilis]|uniref:Pimeloyl-ACP methyl ester carboxylesterase n=1 Tax=Marinobacter mobilis TaxID=488533 RepID=A0A1H2WXD0_9GAMM|nr:alpha/beta hydrolase [Marinobacter mobilis]SDW85221.1 Pimeloyl-ACP methyl ester carboxylesterase [Marinobacter mobilis]SDX67039.1 Pimeloyl-ACP methyl ester carboxylesterase [Marinobacter mobilis]